MAPTFLGGQGSPFLPSLALTPPFPALHGDGSEEGAAAWAGAMTLEKLCQSGMPGDQVLEVLLGLYKEVKRGMELPKCHEHTHPHPQFRGVIPSPHVSRPFLVRPLVC